MAIVWIGNTMIYAITSKRPAIAMIELIFALVIMGITLMSAPMLINRSINSNTVALQQEAIAATAAQISLIMTHAWDESTVGSLAVATMADTSEEDDNLTNRVLANMSRNYDPTPNTIKATAHTALDLEAGGNIDDVDDFNGKTAKLTLFLAENAAFTSNEGDYIDTQVNLTSTIQYASDNAVYAAAPVVFNNPFQNNAPGGSTNIKLINVTLNSIRQNVAEVSDKNISLSAFVCNIGVANELPIVIN